MCPEGNTVSPTGCKYDTSLTYCFPPGQFLQTGEGCLPRALNMGPLIWLQYTSTFLSCSKLFSHSVYYFMAGKYSTLHVVCVASCKLKSHVSFIKPTDELSSRQYHSLVPSDPIWLRNSLRGCVPPGPTPGTHQQRLRDQTRCLLVHHANEEATGTTGRD